MKSVPIKKIGNMIRISEEDLQSNKRFALIGQAVQQAVEKRMARQLERLEEQLLLGTAFAPKGKR